MSLLYLKIAVMHIMWWYKFKAVPSFSFSWLYIALNLNHWTPCNAFYLAKVVFTDESIVQAKTDTVKMKSKDTVNIIEACSI